MVSVEENALEFQRIYEEKIHRSGADKLLDWMKSADFFTAPASRQYHLCVPGGLCQHSLNVYSRLVKLLSDHYGANSPYNEETVAIVALLHDLCKVNLFKESWKNQKTYDPEKVAAANGYNVKHDAAGNFIWESVPTYVHDEELIFGHGEKSVFLIMTVMKLGIAEAQAIRFHMASRKSEDKDLVGKVYEQNPLAFFLHVADEMATYFDEGGDN